MTTAKHQMDKIFVGKDRARFAALRTQDPRKNLVERWRRVQTALPDLATSRLGFMPQMLEHDWAVVGFHDEGFAYTVGLSYHFGHPELLLAALGLPLPAIAQLLNLVGTYVATGHRIGPGERVDLTDFGISLVFQPYSHEVFERFATGYLATFERYFEDRFHETGDTLPVLWAHLAPVKTAKKPAAKKPAAKKPAAKKPAAKKPAVKKPAAKKPAAKKPAPKKPAAKKPVKAASQAAAPRRAEKAAKKPARAAAPKKKPAVPAAKKATKARAAASRR